MPNIDIKTYRLKLNVVYAVELVRAASMTAARQGMLLKSVSKHTSVEPCDLYWLRDVSDPHILIEHTYNMTHRASTINRYLLVKLEGGGEVLQFGELRAGAMLAPLVLPELLGAVRAHAARPRLVHLAADRREILQVELGALARLGPLRPQPVDVQRPTAFLAGELEGWNREFGSIISDYHQLSRIIKMIMIERE